MNKLKWHIAYLAGPMDRLVNFSDAVEWRDYVAEKLWNINMGVLNPCKKPTNEGTETEESRDLRKKLKFQGKYDEVTETMKPIVRVDLRMIDKSDFVIVLIDLDHHSCGSYCEVFHALHQRKPVLCMVKQGKEYTPDWLFGVIPHETIFGTWDDLLSYIYEINDGTRNPGKLWKIFDMGRVFRNLPLTASQESV